MSELDNLDLYVASPLFDRAQDLAHVERGFQTARRWIAQQSDNAVYLDPVNLPYGVRALANAVASLHGYAAQPARPAGVDGASAPDLRNHLRFDEHPAFVFALLWALTARPADSASALPRLDRDWLQTLTPASPFVVNPAKQLAQRFFARVPLLWAEDGRQAHLAQDWRLRIVRYAESAALAADMTEMQQVWSLARYPSFWINALCIARLGAMSAPGSGQAALLQLILQKRRFITIDIETPSVDPLTHSLHLLYLGEWVALYLAALYGVDPAARVPLQLLGISEE